MELFDLDEDFFEPTAVPSVARARRAGPVRVTTPPAQQDAAVLAVAHTKTGAGLFLFGSAKEEPRPFTPISDADALECQQGGQPAVRKPLGPAPQTSAAPKPMDRASALLQQLESKAEQQKAGAWGRPNRSVPTTKTTAGEASGAVDNSTGGGQQPASYNAQGAAPPVLNDSKIEFAQRRWLQTNLGGPKLLIPSGCAPPGFVVAQMLLWLIPVMIGVPLSLVAGSMSSSWLGPAIAGGAMLGLHCTIQLARTTGGSRVAPGEASGKASMLVEEDEIDFALLSRQGFSFLVPALGWATLPYGLCSGALVGVATAYLSPAAVAVALGESNTGSDGISGATTGYLVCCWICVALSAYSLHAQPPPEPNRYSSMEAGGVFGPTSRALHMLLVMVPALAFAGCDVLISRALCAVLPILWATGSLPPADCLVEWVLEQVHVHLLGGSVSASPLRLGVMTTASCAVVALTVLLHQSAGMAAGV